MNHTSLALIAFLLAAMLVISATIAAPAPALGAGGGHSKRSGHGTDRQSNKAETTASGEGSTAITLQRNAATNGLLGYASTFINQKNKAKTTASGEGSTAITFQANEAKGSGHGHSNDQKNKAKTTASGEGSTAMTLQRNAGENGLGYNIKQNNKAKTTASGEGSTAMTLQRNAAGKSL